MESNMTGFVIVSPIGHARVEPQIERRQLGNPIGRSIGFLWNQYPTTLNFWPRLEQALKTLGKPSNIQRAYKKNTWMPIEQDLFLDLTARVDYFVVGVGA